MLVLPAQLREVSAIAVVDESTIACVQDEAGALFFIDITGQRPPRFEVFGPRGDYEGLARVGDDWWVLRSDGTLLRMVRRAGVLTVHSSIRLMGEYAEWESLCYDADLRLLLLMPKDRAGEGAGGRHRRPVFAVDPTTGIVRTEPHLVLDMRGFQDQAAQRGFALPVRTTAKGKERLDLQLACSDLVVVPGSQELLVLSAADGALLRVDREGRLLGFLALDRQLMPQPEGLAMLRDGRLLVATEGARFGAVCVVPMP